MFENKENNLETEKKPYHKYERREGEPTAAFKGHLGRYCCWALYHI